ncbi:hypothetical protein JW859_05025 [bacterium]|nr:hypothetical protein [bacterium]
MNRRGGRVRELLDLRVESATQRRLADEYRKQTERLRSRVDLLTLALLNVWDKLAKTTEFKDKIDIYKLEELRNTRDPRPMLVELLTDVVMLELEEQESKNDQAKQNGDLR